MDVSRFVLVFSLYFVSGINSETVDFFSVCKDSSSFIGSERTVFDSEKLTVRMDDLNWSGFSTSCTVIFKASGSFDYLYIKFNSFDLTNFEIKVEILSKDSYNYRLEDSYSYYNTPSIGMKARTKNYLKVTATRPSSFDNGLSAEFDVFTGDYNSQSNVDETISSVGHTIGTIVGSVLGGIVGIVVIVVVIVCVVSHFSSRRNRGVVMANGNPQVTTTTTAAPMYPYAMHPSAQPVGYPAQPGVYPPNQMMSYPSAPPSYNTVANGNTIPPIERVEEKAP